MSAEVYFEWINVNRLNHISCIYNIENILLFQSGKVPN